MKIYFVVCGVMLLITYIQSIAQILRYLQTHHGVKLRKNTFIQTLDSLIPCIIYFSLPIMNVVVFVYFFCLTDEDWEKLIVKEIEK